MFVITRGRGFGKTHDLIEWVKAKSHRLLVTFSRHEATRLQQLYELNRQQVEVWDAELRVRLAGREVEIAIDNADLVLAHLIQHPIQGLTLTGETR